MKIFAAIALLASVQASAGELLPMSGQRSGHLQEALTATLGPAVIAMDERIKVEPILESIEIHGRGKRILWGPLAGSSHIVLRLKITDGDQVTEKIISEERGAWKGTFRPGEDYEMVNQVATRAAEFSNSYSVLRLTAK